MKQSKQTRGASSRQARGIGAKVDEKSSNGEARQQRQKLPPIDTQTEVPGSAKTSMVGDSVIVDLLSLGLDDHVVVPGFR
jgi:hypothetical protein